MAPENNPGFVEFLEIHHFGVLGTAVFVFRVRVDPLSTLDPLEEREADFSARLVKEHGFFSTL